MLYVLMVNWRPYDEVSVSIKKCGYSVREQNARFIR